MVWLVLAKIVRDFSFLFYLLDMKKNSSMLRKDTPTHTGTQFKNVTGIEGQNGYTQKY